MERQLARIREQIGEVKFFEIRMSELQSLKSLDKI
jgi:hypothetical protein